ncbi:MAG: HAD-IA family hydrolase [Acidobacteriaceae bacterium]
MTIETAGILFDMDGVLISSIGSVNRSWRRWAHHYGLPDADTFQVPHGIRAVDIVIMLKPDIDPNEGLRLIEDIEMVDVDDLKVLPGAQALLQSLPPERWAIVTSATRRLALERLRVAGLPAPERMISAEMVERGKPDPEPYRRGADLIDSPPADCLVVEDAPSGVGAGVAAGCRVLGVLGTHKEEELRQAGASWIVRSLEDVKAQSTAQGLAMTLDTL